MGVFSILETAVGSTFITWGENRTDLTLLIACCTWPAWNTFSGSGLPPVRNQTLDKKHS